MEVMTKEAGDKSAAMNVSTEGSVGTFVKPCLKQQQQNGWSNSENIRVYSRSPSHSSGKFLPEDTIQTVMFLNCWCPS